MILKYQGKDYEPMITRKGERNARQMLKTSFGDSQNDVLAMLDFLFVAAMYKYRKSPQECFDILECVLGDDGAEAQTSIEELTTLLGDEYSKLFGLGDDTIAE
jgi:hypothetical protein